MKKKKKRNEKGIKDPFRQKSTYFDGEKYNGVIVFAYYTEQRLHKILLERIQNIHIIFFRFDQFVNDVVSFLDARYDRNWNLN